MPFSMSPKELPSEEQAIATVHAALDAGVTYFDTADIYAPTWDSFGHNEMILAKAFKAYGGKPDDVVVGTKAGITRGPNEERGRDGSYEYFSAAVDKALGTLEVDVIDLFQWHRPDPFRAYADVVGNLARIRDEGKIKAIGISNANPEEIGAAITVLGEGGLASVQNQFSPKFRYSDKELELCNAAGVSFLPWSPLGGITGSKSIGDRFAVFSKIAADHGVSPHQVVLAWELSRGERVIPIPGASRPESIIDSAKAADLVLSEEELALCTATGGDAS